MVCTMLSGMRARRVAGSPSRVINPRSHDTEKEPAGFLKVTDTRLRQLARLTEDAS